jgi:hypothetical protein
MKPGADMYKCEKMFIEPSIKYEMESCDKVSYFSTLHHSFLKNSIVTKNIFATKNSTQLKLYFS